MSVNLRGGITTSQRDTAQSGEELLIYLVKQIKDKLSGIEDKFTIQQIKVILLCQAIKENNQTDFFELVQAGQINLNQVNHHGEYPIMLAVMYNRFIFLQHLLQKNCNPNIKDALGNTPLRLALQNQFSECIKLLRQCGANVI